MKIELENFKVEKSMFEKLKSGNPVQRDEVSIFVCLFYLCNILFSCCGRAAVVTMHVFINNNL